MPTLLSHPTTQFPPNPFQTPPFQGQPDSAQHGFSGHSVPTSTGYTPASFGAPIHTYGPGVIPPQPNINPPLRPGLNDQAFQSTLRHRLDRLANPDSSSTTKPGSSESIKRLGEIWIYCAMGFAALPVLLCPGIVGKQLALRLKSPNAKIWEIYEHTALPTAFANKLCLDASTLGRGGGPNDPQWAVGEQDFATWAPAEQDKYKSPPGRTLERAKPRSVILETWRRNALNQSLVFALIYGNGPGADLPHLQPRREAIERLYQLHLSNTNKYTLKFIAETWDQLNSRWAEPLEESVNRLSHPEGRTPYVRRTESDWNATQPSRVEYLLTS